MFNLNNASQAIRKAAALQGIRSGQFEPVFSPNNGSESVIARVTNGRKTIEITSGDALYADHLTWREIR